MNVRFASVMVLLWSGLAFGQAPPPPPPAEPAPAAPAPAPEPPPAPPPAQGYPAPPPPAQGQPYPPPAQQPYPYPPPTYPAPGSSPPPNSYPPPQGSYPPPQGDGASYARPAAPPPSRYPEDASTQASPFFDALILGVAADERFSDALLFGGQIGGYVGGWLRLAARLGVFTDPADNSDSYEFVSYDYSQKVELPSILYGASIGVVVARRTRFVFAPGITLNRTDVGDYGTLFGASMPFEWVMRGGTRFGFELAFGRGLGGDESQECLGGGSSCTAGDVVKSDRDPGIFFMVGLNIGFGLGYPEPDAPARK